MFRVFLGIIIGVYVDQNYSVPDVQVILKEFQTTLTKYRKPPPTK